MDLAPVPICAEAELIEPSRRDFLKLVLGAAAATVLNSCGARKQTSPERLIHNPDPESPVVPEQVTTTSADPNKLSKISDAVDVVDVQADRETTPEVLDCSDIPIVVLGDSISLDWPLVTEKMLNDMPDVTNVKITNMALAGSTSISRNPISDKAPKIIETAKFLENYTSEQLKKMIVMFTNGAPEISNLSPGETDETAVQRSVDATIYIYTYLKNLGIGTVIVLPMAPLATAADFLQKQPLNRRVTTYNRIMVEKGLIPPEIAAYKEMIGPDGYGLPEFYDDTVTELLHGPDGEHPDTQGVEVMARTIANLLYLKRFLHTLCRAA